MNILRHFIVICFLLLPIFPSHAQNEPSQVTLLRVLADPEKYHGKEIQVIGYLHLEFEGDGLYLHKEDYDHRIVGNVIWVDTTSDMRKYIKQINNRYVIIRGVFYANDHGHMGLFSGTITKISRCDVWSIPKSKVEKKWRRVIP